MNPPTLLALPNYSPQVGNLPPLPEGYWGYFQSQRRQLVFAYDLRNRAGWVYPSNLRWQPLPCTPSRLPVDLIKDSPEGQWLSACWQSALAITTNMALENLLSGGKQPGIGRNS